MGNSVTNSSNRFIVRKSINTYFKFNIFKNNITKGCLVVKNKLEKLIREYKHIQSDSSLIYDSGLVSEYQNGFEEGRYRILEGVIKDLKNILKNN